MVWYFSTKCINDDVYFTIFTIIITGIAITVYMINNNNNRRLVTLAEHTSDHGRQTNSSTEEKGEQV